MKNSILIIILSLLLGCQTHNKNTIEVYNIRKECSELKDNNSTYYQMCLDWELLTEKEILTIIKYSKEILLPEDISFINAYGFIPDNIYMEASIKKNDSIYNILLGSQSWMLITDSISKKSRLYSCENPKITKYFIGDYATEGDIDNNPKLEERYNLNKNKAIKKISK